MKFYKSYDKSKAIMCWSVFLIAIAILLIFPTQCRNGGTNGVFLCLQVLIPSLFPFMALSGFCVHSGLVSRTPRSLGRLTELLFGLPQHTAMIIILSLLGGYPTGARGIASLYEKKLISKAQAQRMSLFCVASGPGFLITYLGNVMLGCVSVGYILLLSQVISFIILGIGSKITSKKKNAKAEITSITKDIHIGFGITKGVNDAIISGANMCALVIIFSVFCEVLISLCNNTPQISRLTALIEITNGTKILAQSNSLILIAGACGFGGLCVHSQIFSILKNIDVNKPVFILFRIAQGIFCMITTYILLKLFPRYTATFSTVKDVHMQTYSGYVACVFLIVCCVIFLISIRKTNRYKL